jgi:predicted dehydrogenase
MRQFLHVPGVSIQAVCDVYEPRFAQVNKLAGKDVPHTKDYRELLQRNDIDAFLIASPLTFHAEHVLAALKTGKPIYAEKAMGFTPQECQHMLAEIERSKVIYQIGHQYRYASWIQESMRRIKAGQIGDVTHIYAYWHRNNDWRRPVPSPDPEKKLEHLINWRLYRETSGGLVTELGSHHIDIANWVFGEQAESVLGTTSICRYNDGRTVGDNVQATFKYSRGRRLVFSSITDNAKNANEVWIYGTEGSVQLTIEDATFFYEKKKSNAPSPANKTIVERGVETGASYSTKGEMPYRGPGEKLSVGEYEDPTLAACRSFIECVRGEHKPLADARVGYRSAVACAVAHDAVFTEQKTTIPLPRS